MGICAYKKRHRQIHQISFATVLVPANVVPGTAIRVETPDGQTVQVRMPVGAAPGTQLNVGYTAKAGVPVAPQAVGIKQQKATCAHCGALFQLHVTQDGKHIIPCTVCKEQNQIPVKGAFPEGYQEDEFLPPSWWRTSGVLDVPKRSPVSASVRQAVQTLMDNTWKKITTRDRRFGKVSKFTVVNVLHNANLGLWKQYCRARRRIQNQKVRQRIESLTCDFDRSSLGEVDPSIQEFLLFHGTKPTSAESICKSGFRVSNAGSKTGLLYGRGLYFAECSSKSDEYAQDDEQGVYLGLYAMLLCRVSCGNMYETTEKTPNTEYLEVRCKGTDTPFQSVLGDRELESGTYREFIVYNSDQAYPEYVIIYRRVVAEGP